MGDWYIVIKTIKGRRYRYRQKTWREGRHVRTRSEYLGPAEDVASVGPLPTPERSPFAAGLIDEVLTTLSTPAETADADGRLRSLLASWTNIDEPDLFTQVAAGKSLLRSNDLGLGTVDRCA